MKLTSSTLCCLLLVPVAFMIGAVSAQEAGLTPDLSSHQEGVLPPAPPGVMSVSPVPPSTADFDASMPPAGPMSSALPPEPKPEGAPDGMTMVQLAPNPEAPTPCTSTRVGMVALSACYRVCVCTPSGAWRDIAKNQACPWNCGITPATDSPTKAQ